LVFQTIYPEDPFELSPNFPQQDELCWTSLNLHGL
jgi:hypothetical protein